MLTFYFTRTENYNYGGNTCGLRWSLWLIPFWIVALIPLADASGGARGFRLAMIPLFALSAYSAWSRIDNPWRHPWIFEWMESAGLVDISEPRPQLEHALWTWFTAVPDVADGKPRWMEFVNASPTGTTCRLRIEARPSQSGDPRRTRLTLTRSCGDGAARQLCDVELDRTRFNQGTDPTDFLSWPGGVAPEDRQRQLAVLLGLPKPQAYRPGVYRYRRVPLRRDAFHCQHVLSQLKSADDDRHYRCDVWRCEELPFGVAEFEVQVQDAVSGQLLHAERWQAADCEPPPQRQAQWSPLP